MQKISNSVDISARHAAILNNALRLKPAAVTDETRALLDIKLPPGVANKPRAPLMGILLNNPDFVSAYKGFMSFFIVKGALHPRDRELAILRTAWLCQTPFIFGEHVALAKDAGITGDEIERVKIGSSAPGWNRHEQAVLTAVEDLLEDSRISDGAWSVLEETLSAKLLVELIGCIGQYQCLGYFMNSLNIPLLDGNEGLLAR